MNLTAAQEAFCGSDARFPAFVGGYGSGKTYAGILRAISLKTQGKQDVAYYLPTYGLVRDIAYPRFIELLEQLNIDAILNKADATIATPYYGGRIILRTMDNPERIVGYEVAHSVIDELDTLPTDKARDVWNKVISRNRQTGHEAGNTVAVATTPEGFRFVYERWVKLGGDDYKVFKAKTAENPYLPEGYIDSLRETYPDNLLAAYLDGEFVNLNSGTVYVSFDRVKCHSNETEQNSEPLFIGMDFNVGEMSAVIHVKREGKPVAVGEVSGAYDTPDMCRILQERYSGHAMHVYPDASGNSRKTVNASTSDLAILREAGFRVVAQKKNPSVRDRINAMNAAFSNGYKVNTDKCPEYTRCLEQQPYAKSGEPDKTLGLDHMNDGAGYFISTDYPIVKPATNFNVRFAT